MNLAVRVAETKPRLLVTGHFGIGDCIHQRAVVRELMKSHAVTLQSFYTAMYHDLVAEGLTLQMRNKLAPRIRDAGNGGRAMHVAGSNTRITYGPEAIKEHGSIIAAQFASVGLKCPERPDFSLPVRAEWREAARRLIATWNTDGKPVMVYRPIVLNKVWECPARSPDPEAYAALHASIRDRFFVVSVADLTQGSEHIVGPEPDADVKMHRGELPFETLAGLFAEAALVFASPGFAPILAQAVGTPGICVYGANESYRTTNAPGQHLAPTLAIEPAKPCECFARTCACDKTIDLEPAKERVMAFAAKHAAPRALIFATAYVDTPERLRLTQQWLNLHRHLNPGCDFLIVDSASPLLWCEDGSPRPGVELPDCPIWSFPDNIGHLSRNGLGGPSSKGRDGWGRAFCRGLDRAVEQGYDYVAHVEGDSLFRLPLMPIVRQMHRDGVKVASVPVEGTKRKEVGWVETGLMVFDVNYLRVSGFSARYDWPNRTRHPTPERVIFDMLGPDLTMMPWKAERGDKSQITPENVTELDWVTHCHDQPAVYDRFVESVMFPTPAVADVSSASPSLVKLNFGCGRNRLDGWQNFDAEVDIAKRLPFDDASADFIFAEHCVEHVDYYAALGFFKECRRVLKPGGVIRIAVPSLEFVMDRADDAYCAFVRRWAPTADVRGAMHAILFAHGHRAAWTASLLKASLFYAGFDDVVPCEPRQSTREALRDIDGHHRAIGERMNLVETAICEGVRATV